MNKLTSILSKRLSGSSKEKMKELAQKSREGELSTFSAIFGSTPLNPFIEKNLKEILEKYAPKTTDFDLFSDLNLLLSITREVKAITQQAVILHGERIKKAQEILKRYQDGAFSAWLIETYGNRQTPYNFLQYYEFYKALPSQLHMQLESMPRQAIYTLASRKGSFDQKAEIIRNYQGESKTHLLALIRSQFPLPEHDKRGEKLIENALSSLKKLRDLFSTKKIPITQDEQESLLTLIKELQDLITPDRL